MKEQEEIGKALSEIFRSMHRKHGPLPMRQSTGPQRRQEELVNLPVSAINEDEERKQEMSMGACYGLNPQLGSPDLETTGMSSQVSAGGR